MYRALMCFAARKSTRRGGPRAQLPRHPSAAIDRRQSLRQRPSGSGLARALRHRDDRTPSRRAPDADARWSSFAPLPQALASRTLLRLASSFSSARDPLGVSRRKLLWDGSPWLHENPFPLSVTLAKEDTAGGHDTQKWSLELLVRVQNGKQSHWRRSGSLFLGYEARC